jgi:amidophosphoribosyltransferase
MAGLFGVASKSYDLAGEKGKLGSIDCLFYGTDYHSHLGTARGGMATIDAGGKFHRYIHNISNAQFRSKFEDDVKKLRGNLGIGVISDYEDQPLVISSHLGKYAIVSVNRITNLDEIVEEAFKRKTAHFAETGTGELNPSEVIATLINQGASYVEGIVNSQEAIKGSSSLLLLTKEGIYAARDALGRTPLILGKKEGTYAIASESCALPNLGFEVEKELGPGEIVLVTPGGVERKKKQKEEIQICSFMWVYFGYPASGYEGVNVEHARYRCGKALARQDAEDLKSGKLKIDMVAGIPDSGTGHAIGYANESGINFGRPFVKYTPTWPRSFMPPDQEMRDLIARMKLIPLKELVKGKRLLFCEDSIVRGTQLKDTVQRLYDAGAIEVHMRPACPPLIYGCDFLNFSRARSANELAGQKAIRALRGISKDTPIPTELLKLYGNSNTQEYSEMVDWIRRDLKLTTLKYQKLGDLVKAIGLPKEKLCTHCWDGSSCFA